MCQVRIERRPYVQNIRCYAMKWSTLSDQANYIEFCDRDSVGVQRTCSNICVALYTSINIACLKIPKELNVTLGFVNWRDFFQWTRVKTITTTSRETSLRAFEVAIVLIRGFHIS